MNVFRIVWNHGVAFVTVLFAGSLSSGFFLRIVINRVSLLAETKEKNIIQSTVMRQHSSVGRKVAGSMLESGISSLGKSLNATFPLGPSSLLVVVNQFY